MKTLPRTRMLLKGIILALALALTISPAGCVGEAPPGKEVQGGASSDPVVVQANLQDQTLVATVHPIEVMDGYAVLTVDYSIPEDSSSSTKLLLESYMGRSATDFGCSEIRIVDTKTGRVWLPGYYRGATLWSAIASKPNKPEDRISLAPGQSETCTTLFPLVDTDTVDVLFPWLGFAYDVPVVDGNADTPTIESFKEYNEESEVAFHEPKILSSFIKSYDDAQAKTKEGNQQRVILASDVLFATDVYTLSDAAAARVDQVAEEIAEAASGREVKVTGHTDDVGADAYNLDLSNKRAASVAEKLKMKLGASFSIVSEGKGESSPAVEGTDEEARKANRRVEIAFTADQAISISGDTQTPGGTKIPAATTPVATGHNAVEFEFKEHESADRIYNIRASVPSVQRHGDWLVGSVTVTNTGEKLNFFAMLQSVMGSGWELTQQSYDKGFITGLAARSITLLIPDGRVFPAQYTERAEEKSGKTVPYVDILADRLIWTDFNSENSLTYTVVWPDTGQDVVTIEVPDRFRITDIPVEER